jgi:hypothetical protein
VPKDLHLHMHPAIHRKLLRLSKPGVDGRAKPLVAVIEDLIRKAPEPKSS